MSTYQEDHRIHTAANEAHEFQRSLNAVDHPMCVRCALPRDAAIHRDSQTDGYIESIRRQGEEQRDSGGTAAERDEGFLCDRCGDLVDRPRCAEVDICAACRKEIDEGMAAKGISPASPTPPAPEAEGEVPPERVNTGTPPERITMGMCKRHGFCDTSHRCAAYDGEDSLEYMLKAAHEKEVAPLRESLAHVLSCSGTPSDCDDCNEAEVLCRT